MTKQIQMSWVLVAGAALLLAPWTARAQRTGCPIARASAERSHATGLLAPGQQVCTSLDAQPGERLNAVTNATHGDYELWVGNALGALQVVGPGTGGDAKAVRHKALFSGGLHTACVRNTSSGSALGVRMTLDLLEATCDAAPSFCFGARGPDCGPSVTFGMGCSAANPANRMLRLCSVSVGAARHDSCCARYPGGKMCGGTDWNGQPTPNLFAMDRPSGLGWPYDYPNWPSYQVCQKEWDMAFFDSNGAWAVWDGWFDGTQPTYRNRPSEIELTSPRITPVWGTAYYDEGGPTARARRAPPPTELYLSDASRGWCSTGLFHVTSGNKAVCYVETCSDRARNQNESDVDCGGVCGGCANGLRCNAGSDCVSGVCSAGVCQASATSTNPCANGQWDPGESDVDCGGVCYARCESGMTCTRNSDCQSNSCFTAEYMCR